MRSKIRGFDKTYNITIIKIIFTRYWGCEISNGLKVFFAFIT